MKYRLYIVLMLVMLAVAGGCAALPMAGGGGLLPPVLSMDEVNRPYVTLGRIQVTRTVYGTDYLNPPNLYEWALQALREEAGKMEADAVILPEVSSKEAAIFIFPSFPATEYRAAGVAVRFAR